MAENRDECCCFLLFIWSRTPAHSGRVFPPPLTQSRYSLTDVPRGVPLCNSRSYQVDNIKPSHWEDAERNLAGDGGQLEPHSHCVFSESFFLGPERSGSADSMQETEATEERAACLRVRSAFRQIKGTQMEPCGEVIWQEPYRQRAILHPEAGAVAGFLSISQLRFPETKG